MIPDDEKRCDLLEQEGLRADLDAGFLYDSSTPIFVRGIDVERPAELIYQQLLARYRLPAAVMSQQVLSAAKRIGLRVNPVTVDYVSELLHTNKISVPKVCAI